jgi:hypothetical protein
MVNGNKKPYTNAMAVGGNSSPTSEKLSQTIVTV